MVSAAAFGMSAALTFDKAIVVASGGAIDGAVTFNGVAADSFAQVRATTVNFNLSSSVNAGDPWGTNAQPGWAVTPIAWPATGSL